MARTTVGAAPFHSASVPSSRAMRLMQSTTPRYPRRSASGSLESAVIRTSASSACRGDSAEAAPRAAPAPPRTGVATNDPIPPATQPNPIWRWPR